MSTKSTNSSREEEYAAPHVPDEPSTERAEPSKDELFEVLSNRRRRYALHYLEWRDGVVQLDDLAERIAAWENGAADAVTSAERKRVYTALQQFHLPKMEQAGLVKYDERRGVIERTEAEDEIDIYLDLVPEDEIPWSYYYIGLSIIGLFLTGLSALGLPLLSALSPAVWAAGFVCLTLLSALIHAHRDREHRLGGAESPPETTFE